MMAETKVCPFCAEMIKEKARKCHYCGEYLEGFTRDSVRREIGFDQKGQTVDGPQTNIGEVQGDIGQVGDKVGGDKVGRDKITIKHCRELRDEQYKTTLNWEIKGKPPLREFNLAGRNLSGRCLAGADLSGADLSGANLHKAELFGANLSEANVYGAKLSESDLRRTNLSGANLEDANLWSAKLIEAKLHRIILDHANLADTNLTKVEIVGRSLHGAILKRAILRNAKVAALVVNADLSDAELQGADLSEVPDMWRVGSVVGAKYDKDTKWPEDFDPEAAGAILVDDEGSPVKELEE